MIKAKEDKENKEQDEPSLDEGDAFDKFIKKTYDKDCE